jgi:hypothetical protein
MIRHYSKPALARSVCVESTLFLDTKMIFFRLLENCFSKRSTTADDDEIMTPARIAFLKILCTVQSIESRAVAVCNVIHDSHRNSSHSYWNKYENPM